MSDLISRSALIKMLRFKRRAVYGSGSMDDIARVIEDVEKFPAAKVGKTQKDKPVLHGKWGEYETHPLAHSLDGFPCSVCGLHQDDIRGLYYCPNCGAKMDGDEDAID